MSDGKTPETMFEELRRCLDGLDGAERELTEEMLRSFCWYSCKVDELTARIDREGAIVQTPKGDRPNPANGPLHQYAMRKGDFYTKILKAVSGAGVASTDRLAAFVGR